MAIMSLDPTGKGQARWAMRWKTEPNAFDITFDGQLSAARRELQQPELHRSFDRPVPGGKGPPGLDLIAPFAGGQAGGVAEAGAAVPLPRAFGADVAWVEHSAST
ncbi:hypothetical protein [Streptomyces sp. NPDC054797]